MGAKVTGVHVGFIGKPLGCDSHDASMCHGEQHNPGPEACSGPGCYFPGVVEGALFFFFLLWAPGAIFPFIVMALCRGRLHLLMEVLDL